MLAMSHLSLHNSTSWGDSPPQSTDTDTCLSAEAAQAKKCAIKIAQKLQLSQAVHIPMGKRFLSMISLIYIISAKPFSSAVLSKFGVCCCDVEAPITQPEIVFATISQST